MQLGGPQGLLLAKQSARAVFIDEATQKAFVVERRFIAFAVTEDLIHHFWIFLGRGISFPNQTCKEEGIENGTFLTSLDIERFSFLGFFTDKWHATGYGYEDDGGCDNGSNEEKKASSLTFLLSRRS